MLHKLVKKEGALFMPTTLNLTDLTYFGDSHKEVNISSSNNQCFFFFFSYNVTLF